MNHKIGLKIQNGEAPVEWYQTPNTPDELVRIITKTYQGATILKDTPLGHRFSFGRTENGRFAFETDEYLNFDETNHNPDYHLCRYDTARDGVAKFRINGKPLFECVKGCRIWAKDCGMVYPD